MYLCVRGIDNARNENGPCICVLRVYIMSCSTIFLLDFGTVSTICFFIINLCFYLFS